jgi:hypothetical protein
MTFETDSKPSTNTKYAVSEDAANSGSHPPTATANFHADFQAATFGEGPAYSCPEPRTAGDQDETFEESSACADSARRSACSEIEAFKSCDADRNPPSNTRASLCECVIGWPKSGVRYPSTCRPRGLVFQKLVCVNRRFSSPRVPSRTEVNCRDTGSIDLAAKGLAPIAQRVVAMSGVRPYRRPGI